MAPMWLRDTLDPCLGIGADFCFRGSPSGPAGLPFTAYSRITWPSQPRAMRLGDCQLLPSPEAPSAQHVAAARAAHPLAEPVGALAVKLLGLVRPLGQDALPFCRVGILADYSYWHG